MREPLEHPAVTQALRWGYPRPVPVLPDIDEAEEEEEDADDD